MLEKIRRYVEKWHMIENGDKIICRRIKEVQEFLYNAFLF